MSSHAATIRHYLSDEFDDYSEAFAALDALLAENQQLREALRGLLSAVEDHNLDAALGDDKFKSVVAARQVLAAVGEE